jgi:hypothetical protein
VLLRVIEMEPVDYDDAALLENVTNSRGMAAAQQSGDIALDLGADARHQSDGG